MRELGIVNSDLMTGRYGGAGASAAWGTVLDLYYQDRMEEAFQFALSLGAGDAAFGTHTYRMVEAEWRAREYGVMREVNEFLSVEAPGALSEEGWNFLREVVREEFLNVCGRLGYEPVEKILVSLMIPESDAPWTPYRHGFFVDKEPYDKVVLPVSLLQDGGEFCSALRHEFAHGVNLNLAQGRMGAWMEESIAMTMGGRLDDHFLRALRADKSKWMEPRELNGVFQGDRRIGDGRAIWRAYEQAGLLGRYLVGLKGESALGELARGFANNSGWKDLAMRITGQSGEDEALREVFGMSEGEVFSEALASATLG